MTHILLFEAPRNGERDRHERTGRAIGNWRRRDKMRAETQHRTARQKVGGTLVATHGVRRSTFGAKARVASVSEAHCIHFPIHNRLNVEAGSGSQKLGGHLAHVDILTIKECGDLLVGIRVDQFELGNGTTGISSIFLFALSQRRAHGFILPSQKKEKNKRPANRNRHDGVALGFWELRT